MIGQTTQETSSCSKAGGLHRCMGGRDPAWVGISLSYIIHRRSNAKTCDYPTLAQLMPTLVIPSSEQGIVWGPRRRRDDDTPALV